MPHGGAGEGNRSPAAGPPIKLGGESLARVQTAIPTEVGEQHLEQVWDLLALLLPVVESGGISEWPFRNRPSLCLPRLAAGEFPPLPHLGIATKSSQLLAYGGFLR